MRVRTSLRYASGSSFMRTEAGRISLLDALHRCLRNSSEVASAAVVVDAKDETAGRFYEHFEFMSLPDTPGRRFLR